MPAANVDQKFVADMLETAKKYFDLISEWCETAKRGSSVDATSIQITGIVQVKSAAERLLKMARRYDGHFKNWQAEAEERGQSKHAEKPARKK